LTRTRAGLHRFRVTVTTAFARVSLASLTFVIAACGLLDKKTPQGDDSSGKPEPTSQASGSSGPVGSASAAPDASLFTYPRRSVAAGKSPIGGAWTAAFTVERQAGNEGLALEYAAKFCLEQGRALCTETQWYRACIDDPKLGKLESWTLSLEGKQSVVRGGTAGCPSREVVAPTETKLERVAVCCDRAVAIMTTNDNESFLTSSAKRLLDYERATRRSSASQLRTLLDDTVIYGGKERKQDQVVKAFEKAKESEWTVLDTCEVNIDKDASETRLVSDCQVVYHHGGAFSSDTLRLVHGGPESKLQLIGKPEHMSLLGGEKKERVRSFLGGD
jgi:hypothetical protein